MERMKKILSSPLTRKKSTSTPAKVFGAPLETLSRSYDGSPTIAVPFIITRICQYIEKNGMSHEGIFRISGNARLIERLKSSFNVGGDAPLEAEGDVASAAALLKLFLRELPDPVVPVSAQDSFLQAARSNTQNAEQCVTELKHLVHLLPEEHLLVLQYLVRFLLAVSLLEEQNRMSASSLGIVFGPNLFRVSDDFGGLRDQAVTNQIVTTLIKNYAVIFEENYIDDQKLLETPVRSVTQPLSVFIPSVDLLTLRGHEYQEKPTKQIPVLMVDSFLDNEMDTSHLDLLPGEQTSLRVSAPVCRKRKERTISGEDHQAFCSEPRLEADEEESALLLGSQQIRRCSSHEELRISADTNTNRDRRKSSTEVLGANLLRSSYGHVIVLADDKELSPHPPKPKRRELESAFSTHETTPDTTEPQHQRASHLDQYDFHEMQRSAERLAPCCLSSRNRRPSSRCRKSCSEGEEVFIVNSSEHQSCLSHQDPNDLLCQDGGSQSEVLSQENSLESGDKASLDNLGLELFRQETFVKMYEKCDQRIPHLDLNTLHAHGDGNEPIPSEQRFSWSTEKPSQEAMISPSAQHIKKSNTLKGEEAMESSVKQLNRKIKSVKKSMKTFEDVFEKEHGFRPSIAEKMNFPEIKKLLLDMNRTRKELRELKDESQTCDHTSPNQERLKRKSLAPSVEDSLQDALRNLSAKRRLAQRPDLLEEMTQDQIHDEKLSIQKVLLRFESIHGRPMSKNDRDVMRPLYDRYRNVKRIMSRSSSLGVIGVLGGKSKDSTSELQPILEHETLDITSPQHVLKCTETDYLNLKVSVEAELERQPSTVESLSDESVESPGERLLKDRQLATSPPTQRDLESKSSNLHELPLSELMDQQQQSRLEKRRVRRFLREFEESFQRQTGRRAQKEERTPMESVYTDYKHIKARLKLLEALISKHEQV